MVRNLRKSFPALRLHFQYPIRLVHDIVIAIHTITIHCGEKPASIEPIINHTIGVI